MIYTHGLDQSINHIMVYDGNTPVAVIKLDFNYNPNSIDVLDFDEAGWVKRVEYVLINCSKKWNIDLKNLSAKPIKVIPQWSL